ncbi:MAG: DUF2723 domain-containing protein [Bacteroidota bacterium]
MTYKTLNNIGGWLAFGFSLIVYIFSMAPTASFWDCGEFIACANELEVPHPPGAPFFLLTGRFFALFAPDVESVAYMVNLVSALSSAFCVMFIFWTVTYLAKKMVAPNEENPQGQTLISILLAGLVGAATCTFADSFWFNAVEAEVYAMSSFFTAAVVWLMFKWEARADEPDNLKWIVLIAFVMGISIGVHLLNLLTVPALAFIYYFKKFDFKWQGAAITFGISVFILAFIQYGVIQQSVEIAWGLEKWLTGTEEMTTGLASNRGGAGLPFGTGVTIFLVLVLGSLVAVTWITQSDKLSQRILTEKRQNARVVINAVAWSIVMIIIGYSSYAMILFRANAGTPINENDPSSVASILSYLKREQYGDRPLFRGVRYNDLGGTNQILIQERRAFVNLNEPRNLPDGNYTLEDGKTLIVQGNKAQNFAATANADGAYEGTVKKDGRIVRVDMETKAVTRVEDRYVWNGYKQDVDYKRGKVLFPRMHSGQANHYAGDYGYSAYTTRKGASQSPLDDKPSRGDDLRFFFDYQIRHMYLRYFMWNFAGREGDVQDDGWESGFEFGKLSALPDELRDHQGRNHYYLIPLLLGLFGLVYQFLRTRKDAVSILLLFFFTGIAIIIYLNQTPYQPRERDYSYAGSFQTFAMWVGLGVIGLYDLMRDLLKNFSGYAAGALGLIAPILMGTQNWDDHSRFRRYVAPDSAYNLLNSCEKNGILFTNGDNDTFPLWYIQEVEGVRTDVRVVNLSLLNTDWYIDQMKRQQNESPPLPISAKQIDYLGDKNAIRGWPRGTEVTLDVNPTAVLANGTVQDKHRNLVVSPMKWAPSVRGGERSYLLKQDWLILDIMRNNARSGWKRPIYFSSTIPPSSYIGLQPFFQVEGLANRVVPVDFSQLPKIEDPYGRSGRLDPEISLERLRSFRYTGLNDPDLYLDDHIRRTIVGNLASMIFRCANSFVAHAEYFEGENKVLNTLLMGADTTGMQRDSLQRLVDRNSQMIAEYRKQGEEVLVLYEEKIHDNVRGNDVVVPMFNGMVWQRLGRNEKAVEYYSKVLTKAEEWVRYRQEREVKLRDYDRVVSTAGYIIGQARNMQDFALAARAAELVFQDTGDPQYQTMAEQFRSMAPAEITPPALDSAGQ